MACPPYDYRDEGEKKACNKNDSFLADGKDGRNQNNGDGDVHQGGDLYKFIQKSLEDKPEHDGYEQEKESAGLDLEKQKLKFRGHAKIFLENGKESRIYRFEFRFSITGVGSKQTEMHHQSKTPGI